MAQLPKNLHAECNSMLPPQTPASVYSIASPVGCLLGGVSMDVWGRRRTLIIGCLGMTIGWIMIAFAQNAATIIIGRIIEGVSRTATTTSNAAILDELASPKYRGFIYCSVITCVSVGIMAISSLGILMNWRTASALAGLISLVNLFSFWILHESPVWFVKKNRLRNAETSLKWLCGPGKSLQAREELETLTKRLPPKEDCSEASRFKRILKSVKGIFVSRIMKPFLILLSYNLFQAFCGLGILTYYAVDIISRTREAGTEIMEDFSVTLLVSIIRVVTICISSFLMFKVGRRTLSMISGTLSAISAIFLATILWLRKLDNDSPILPETESQITFSLLLMYAGSMSFGFFGLPSLMIGETQSPQVRGIASGYIFTLNDLLLGGVVKLYPSMISTFQIHGLFLFFGVSCVLCTVFVYIFLPETQGLTLQQIEDYFRQPNIMWISRNKHVIARK